MTLDYKAAPRWTYDQRMKRTKHVYEIRCNSIEEVDLEPIVNSYGIGVDCHSRFFQVCAPARCETVVLK
jgi:hypothetical protein